MGKAGNGEKGMGRRGGYWRLVVGAPADSHAGGTPQPAGSSPLPIPHSPFPAPGPQSPPPPAASPAIRNNSFADVLARVFASTRLTMIAAARLWLPSAAGRLPGTTTLPGGTRPWWISPVLRS